MTGTPGPEPRRFGHSLRDAAAGFVYALRTQRNMRIHVGVALAVLLSAGALGVEGVEWGLLLAAIGGVLGAELLNTAVEAAVDLSVHEWHPVAKVAKDTAAAAVLVQAVVASALGYVVLAPRLPAPLGLLPAIFWMGAALAARRARNGSGRKEDELNERTNAGGRDPGGTA